MKQIISILLAILLYSTFQIKCFSQEWVSFNGQNIPQKPLCIISEQDEYHILIDVEIFGFYSEEIIENGVSYQKITLPEYFTTFDIGKAALPIISKLIQIPENDSISISIENTTKLFLDSFIVYPYQTGLLEDEVREGFDFDTIFYTSTNYYPENTFSYGETMQIRDINITNLILAPISYNPNLSKLEITKSFQIRIDFENEFNYISSQYSKSFDKIFSNSIMNYNSPMTILSPKSTDYSLLIITPEKYMNPQDSKLNEFINWKNQKGYKTKVVSIEEIYPYNYNPPLPHDCIVWHNKH